MHPRASDLKAELLAERQLPADAVWDAAEARLDRPISHGLNLAHEACDRWATDRARLALVLAHEDGSSERWTFADLGRTSSRLAAAFRAGGLRPGDRVAGVMSRQVEAYLCALAAWRIGAIYTPLYGGFGPDALTQRLTPAKVQAVVVDHRFRDNVLAAQERLAEDPVVYCVAGDRGRGIAPGDHSFWAAVDAHAPNADVVPTAADHPASLMFTSGTSGAPKGCIQPHSIIVNLQPYVRHTFALTARDMMFSGADPGWTYGLYGTGFAVMAVGMPRIVYTGSFDERAWLRVFEREQVTYAAAAPSALRRVARAAARDGLPSSFRGATSAGEALDAPLTSAWEACGGGPLQDAYGSSESAFMLANLAHDSTPLIPGRLASVMPGLEVALIDDRGEVVPDEGTLAMRRPRYQASIGYWDNDRAWRDQWLDDWFLTGDTFRHDEDGYWRFLGRNDDVIVSSGHNVGPSEVEEVILEHPDVREVAVIGEDDPERGSVVKAVLVLAGPCDQQRVQSELEEAVRRRVGRHAQPRRFQVVEALPRTETGKLKRRSLRDRR